MAMRLRSAMPWATAHSTASMQIVVHLAAPLQVAGVDERLAEAGRAAEVHRQHGIAAICQPLVLGLVAVAVAAPRAAMHQQHHRPGPFALAAVVPTGRVR